MRHKKERGHRGQQQAADYARPGVRFARRRRQVQPMGTMPIIIARAVINTGRRRTKPASSEALRASPTRTSSRSRAKLTTRIELAVATPMHMMAGKRRYAEPGLVRKRNQTMPCQSRRKRGDDEKTDRARTEVYHNQQVDQQDGEGEAS